jgi:hypothetical protein
VISLSKKDVEENSSRVFPAAVERKPRIISVKILVLVLQIAISDFSPQTTDFMSAPLHVV